MSTGKAIAAGAAGGVYCGLATMVWFVFTGDNSGLVALFGWLFMAPVAGVVGFVLGMFCLRDRWYRFGPAGPVLLSAVAAFIFNGLLSSSGREIALVGLAVVFGVVGHYVLRWVGLALHRQDELPPHSPGSDVLDRVDSFQPRRDVLQIVVVGAFALMIAVGLASSENRSSDVARETADSIVALTGVPTNFRSASRITLVRDDPCRGLRNTYLYELQDRPTSDLRARAESMATTYVDAGYTVQRWVQFSANRTVSDAVYVIYGVNDTNGVRVFVNDDRMSATVHIDCGNPFSLDRGEWRDHTVDVFPPPS